jgi:hypothetical protein
MGLNREALYLVRNSRILEFARDFSKRMCGRIKVLGISGA